MLRLGAGWAVALVGVLIVVVGLFSCIYTFLGDPGIPEAILKRTEFGQNTRYDKTISPSKDSES